ELDDGSLVAGGRFQNVDGVAKKYLAKLDADGALDADWPAASPNTDVNSVAQQADGKFVVAGTFSAANGWSVGLDRLNADGSLDTSFNDGNVGFGPNTDVYQVAVQDDGKILVLIDPATYNGPASYNGAPVSDLFRLEADG